MKYLKNAILCAGLVALGATQSIYSMNETPIEEGGPTEDILRELRRAKPEKWCLEFPGDPVCHSYFKQLACDKRISVNYRHDFYVTTRRILDLNGYTYATKGYVNLDLDKELGKKRIHSFTTYFDIKGKTAIDKFKNNPAQHSDSHTSCEIEDEWMDRRGIDMIRVFCKTSGLTYKQFVRAMKK